MESGIAYKTASLCSIWKRTPKTHCKIQIFAINIKRAARKPFKIKGSFSLLISSSTAPSRTIKINPIVPKTGIRFSKKSKSL
jgi:hypothetical protein